MRLSSSLMLVIHTESAGCSSSQATTAAWLKLFHYHDGVWENITTSVDQTLHRVCGETLSFSPFMVAQAYLPPPAPPSEVTATAGNR